MAAQLGNADIIQPGLVQLQPNLDDLIMDTLEPLPSLQGNGRPHAATRCNTHCSHPQHNHVFGSIMGKPQSDTIH